MGGNVYLPDSEPVAPLRDARFRQSSDGESRLDDDLGAELDALSRRSAFTADDDLVFGHPQTGRP
jgi:hypothetical protein